MRVSMIKLFCFPCAGGTAQMYFKWKKELSGFFEIIPIELAGRGLRSSEPLYKSFFELVDDVATKVEEKIVDSTQYALLGFSMGALITYEVYQVLKKKGCVEPLHLFFLGREAPDCKILKINHLSDDDFLREIISYEGIPHELSENEEILRFFLPILRADFKIHEQYCNNYPLEVSTNMSVIWGKEDKSIIRSEMSSWQRLCNKTCSLYELDGSHFFINTQEHLVLQLIKNILIKK